MAIGIDDAYLIFKLWRKFRPFRAIKERRARKKRLIEQETNMKKWSKSLTIQGIAVAILTSAFTKLGIGDAIAAPELVEWIIEGATYVSLAVAAYGRKRAAGPLI